MRIILIGQALFGARTFEELPASGEDVIAVYTPPGSPESKPNALKEAAHAQGVKTVIAEPGAYKNDEVFREFAAMRPDLVVLAYVPFILPVRYFAAASRGAICYHPSLLPRHRGASAINWALIKGESRTGLTIFWPDERMDAGPILLQREIDIGPHDTMGSIYFDRLFPLGVEAIVESAKLIRQGKAPRIAQDESISTYEPRCDDRFAGIDWECPGRRIYDLIRGCDPHPGAYSKFREELVRFYGASFVPGKIGGGIDLAPGVVTGLDLKGLRIAVDGGELLVTKVHVPAAGKVDAASWAQYAGVWPGERFGGSSK
jgi:methionyl-tRNA formyltransferase